MKILSYRQAVDRIEWLRAIKQGALRDDALAAVTGRLLRFKPNTPLNIKCPWQLDRFSLRAWCPLHDGRWVRLIVRADDDGHLTFHCDAGCGETQVRDHIGSVGESAVNENFPRSANLLTSPRVLDARHRFQSHKKTGGAWESGSYDDPAA